MSETYKQAPRLIHRGKKMENTQEYFYQLPQNLMSKIFYELDGKHGNQIKLMCVLIGTAGDGTFRVSRRWMMEQTGMDESGYTRARKALIDRGWLTLKDGILYVNFDAIRNGTHDVQASELHDAPSDMKAPPSDDGWG